MSAAAARPPAPIVTGPRVTTSQNPVFRFKAAGAITFRCAFDSPRLHGCPATYRTRLSIGSHVLRVQGVDRRGARGPVRKVIVVVQAAPPPLEQLGIVAAIPVGAFPGAPATGFGSVWVPSTAAGTLTRIDAASNAAIATIPAGRPSPDQSAGGIYYDSVAVGAGAVWYASDFGGTVTRIDPATNRAVATIGVPPVVGQRPVAITTLGGAVWTGSFSRPVVTRIDAATNAVTARVQVTGQQVVGIASGAGSVWALSLGPPRLTRIDPGTGAVLATVDVSGTGPSLGSTIEAWWLAADDRGVWVGNQRQNSLARVDPATNTVTARVRLPSGREPWGISVGPSAVWAVNSSTVFRVDPATARVTGRAALPSPGALVWDGVAAGQGAVWVTDYDHGALLRVAAAP